ncbi:MAG: shikimate kinase [Myxococcota bacterium]
MATLTPSFVSLVGLMGTGKSSVAHALAARWPGYVAVDLDEMVIALTGRPIGDIFRHDGEAAFRALEARCLDVVLAEDLPIILATGGGAPCQPGVMDKLLAAGLVVWLDAPPSVLVARALTADRPLLAGRSPAEAEAFLSAQLLARRPFYARATHTVDAARPLAAVVQAIDDAVHLRS